MRKRMENRTIASVSEGEAKQILVDLLKIGVYYTCLKHHITYQMLEQMKKQYKHLVSVAPMTVQDEVQACRLQGLNSIQTAEKLNMTLEQVNKMWASSAPYNPREVTHA